jgi:hypothetical protein
VVVPDTKRRLTSETLYPGPVSSNSTPDKVVPYDKIREEDQLRPLTTIYTLKFSRKFVKFRQGILLPHIQGNYST